MQQQARLDASNDYKSMLDQRKVQRAFTLQERDVEAEYFLTALRNTHGNFAKDISRHMYENGVLPRGRGLTITLEIVAKYYSNARKGSIAYESKHGEAFFKFDLLEKLWKGKRIG